MTYLRILSQLRDRGYRCELFFLWLPSAEFAVERVKMRVKQGGHSVPEVDIRRRYRAGLHHFFNLYQPVLDTWWLYDAAVTPPQVIIVSSSNELESHSRFQQIRNSVARS